MSALETPRNCPDRLVETLRSARDVLVLTGAGISAESGLPTFRDPLCGLGALQSAGSRNPWRVRA